MLRTRMLYRFASLSLLLGITVVNALLIPTEVSSYTGLSEDELKALLTPIAPAPFIARSSCAANNTAGGVYPGPTAPTSYDLLKRNSFVERKGSKLELLGEEFRIVGANIYWLGLDENVIPDPAYPSTTRVLEVLGDVNAMRGTVVRSHTLGISFGNPLSVEPSLDVFNDKAYEAIDFAIMAARVYGIKLIIPLVDNYNYYSGGKYQFIQWHGIPFEGTGANITPPDVGGYFFNTTAIVNSFKRFIEHHLKHVNQYTGIPLGEDPTILAWESGNELSLIRFGDGPAPPSWTKEIGELVKSLAPRQLFMDGTYGIYSEAQLKTQVVDIFSNHYYPLNITKFNSDLAMVTKAGRNYLAGEIDWTGLNGGDPLTSFLAVVAKSPSSGDIYWSMFGHDDQCCQYVEHDDGFSFYYLREDPTDLYVGQGKKLVEHAVQITGRQVPEILPAVACPQYSFPAALVPPGVHLP